MDSDNNMVNLSYDSYDYNYEDPKELGSYDILDIVINSVLLCIGLCGNIWMIWSLCKTKQVGNRAQFYLLPLCITEMLGLIIYVSMYISIRVTYSWLAGDAGCKILIALIEFSTLGHYILVGFNLDNIITVIRGHSTKTIRVVFLVLAVLCSVAIAIPQAVMHEVVEIGSRHTFFVCTTDMISRMLNLLAAVGVPIVLVCIFGGLSICLWCAKKEALSQSAFKEDGSGADAEHVGKDVGLALVLDLFLIVCWSPLLLIRVALDFSGSYDMVIFVTVNTLASANSCINPLIYAVFLCLNRRQMKVSPEL